jgi:hypothetical protein
MVGNVKLEDHGLGWPGQKSKIISKVTRAKRAEGMSAYLGSMRP